MRQEAAGLSLGPGMAINTVQGLIDNNVRLTAWCNHCRHHDVLDLDALGQRLGFDHSTLGRRSEAAVEMHRLRQPGVST